MTPIGDCCGNQGDSDCGLSPVSTTGWCLVSTGQPVLVVTTLPCPPGDPSVAITTMLVDPATGLVVLPQAIRACGDRDWEVNQLCDYDPDTGALIATFEQIFEWDETTSVLTVTNVRADDPTIVYVPVGIVRSCTDDSSAIDIEVTALCYLLGESSTKYRGWQSWVFLDGVHTGNVYYDLDGVEVVGAIPTDCIEPYCPVVAHADTGWCLAETGEPVILVTTIPCNAGNPGVAGELEVVFLDPVTGDVVTTQPVKACGDKDWELNQLCDYDAETGVLLATFIQIFEWDETTSSLNVTLVRSDDPTIPYVVVGDVRSCGSSIVDVEMTEFCYEDLLSVSGVSQGWQAWIFIDGVHTGDIYYGLDAVELVGPLIPAECVGQQVIIDITGSPFASVNRITNIGNALQQCIPSNPDRRQLIIVAEGGGTMLVKFGSGVTITSYTYIIPANGTLELQQPQLYTGQICIIKQTGGTNNIQWTEVFV